jgi:hypothetical protein
MLRSNVTFDTYMFSIALFWTAKQIALVILCLFLWSVKIITPGFCKLSRELGRSQVSLRGLRAWPSGSVLGLRFWVQDAESITDR